MKDQELIQWELEQIERAGLGPMEKATAQILWTVRGFVRSNQIDRPLSEWNMVDIIRAARGRPSRKRRARPR